MKVFVTGGAGFIGSHTVDALIEKGHQVTVYDSKSWSDAFFIHPHGKRVQYIEGDILDREKLERSMEKHSHVLHLAAVVSVAESIRDPIQSHAVNVTGTLNVIEAARILNVERIVYASSAAVYGAQAVIPISEEVTLFPQSPYGVQKGMNDTYARLYSELFGKSILGLRYFNVYGTRQDPHSPYSGVVSIFSERVRSGKPVLIYGDGSVTRDFVSVHDVAEANIQALSTDASGTCNIGSGEECSLNQLLSHLEIIVDRSVERLFEPTRTGDIVRSCACIEKARALLGYAPHVTLEQGLRELIL